MKPVSTMSHKELRSARRQNLRPANAYALQFDYVRFEEGFASMR